MTQHIDQQHHESSYWPLPLQPEYYMGFTVLFLFGYIGIEMGKPSKPSHFEPEMYKVKK